MGKITGIALLSVGVVLLVYGVNASESVTSFFSNMFSGTPSNKTITFLGLGAILTTMGLFSFFGGTRLAD